MIITDKERPNPRWNHHSRGHGLFHLTDSRDEAYEIITRELIEYSIATPGRSYKGIALMIGPEPVWLQAR